MQQPTVIGIHNKFLDSSDRTLIIFIRSTWSNVLIIVLIIKGDFLEEDDQI